MARKIQPKSRTPKPQKGQSSEDYWREREERQRAENIRNEARTAERINRIFRTMQDSIQQEIESFYQRYADKEGITLAEARGRVSNIDMEQYERLAKRYVEAAHHGDRDLAFSDEANEQMRLYNATMRINRLEMLKARCGIRAMEGYRDTERLINDNLEERAYSEYSRLAGILGNSVQFNENMVRAIVNASYQNATWSQRLWTHQATLSERIGAQLAQGILTGKSSTVLAREIQKLTGGSTYACQRLMRTELRRVQTEAALQSMTDNGVTEYKFIVANGVNPCEECLALDGQVFKLSDMNVGKNAPPIHPSCHCASAPHVDEAKWQRWLDGPAQAGVPWAEFEGNTETGSTSTTGRDIIELTRKEGTHRKSANSGYEVIPKALYHKLTKPAIKAGADIRYADNEYQERLNKMGARAVTLGDVILFREDATTSDVIEEVFHFWQNHRKKYSKYGHKERELLCEIEVKEYLLSVTEKYNIPRIEQEETKEWLKIYKDKMREMKERGEWNEPNQ